MENEKANKNQNFRICLIEDEVEIAELLAIKLRRENFEVAHIQDFKNAIEKITDFKPNLLLIDQDLGDITGKEIILEIQKNNLNIPFIMITGSGNEELAVEIMKMGAKDYMIKNSQMLKKLVPVISQQKKIIEMESSLEDAQKKLVQNEQKFRLIAENTWDLIAIHKPDGEYIYVSPSSKNILGYTPEELMKQNFFSDIHSFDEKRIKNTLNLNENESKTHYIYRKKTKEGNHIWLEAYSKAIKDSNNKILHFVSSCRDITERILWEETIKESELKYSTLVENANDGIIIIQDGLLKFVNQTMAKMLGYEVEQIENKSPLIFFQPQDLIFLEMLNTEENSKKQFHETKILDNKQNIHNIEISASKIIYLGEDAILSVIRDITDRRETEAILKENQLRLQLSNFILNSINKQDNIQKIIDKTTEQIHQYFPLHRISYGEYNDKTKQVKFLYSCPSRHLKTLKNTSINFDAKDLPCLQRVLEGKSRICNFVGEDKTICTRVDSEQDSKSLLMIPVMYEKKLHSILRLDAENEHEWSSNEVVTIREVAKHLSVAFQEIYSAQKIKKVEELYRSVFTNSIVGIIVTEKESSKIVDCNQAAADILRFSKQELISSELKKFYTDLSQRETIIKLIEEEHKVENYELQLEIANGSKRWVLVNVNPLVTENGVLLINLINDITPQKEVREELKKYRLHLEEMVKERTEKLESTLQREKKLTSMLKDYLKKEQEMRAEMSKAMEKERELINLKSRFVAMASHEFRTPLTTILSASDILARYDDQMSKEDKIKRITKIREQVKNMTMMLDDILLIGKVESGKYNFATELVEFTQFIKTQVKDFQLSLGKNHILNFNTQIEAINLEIDKRLFQNIVTNLLSNAIKYSKEQSQINVEICDDSKNILLKVQDQGIGIPKENLKRLFEPFFRAENVGNISGTGLGLAIIKKSIEMHQGVISVESTENKGSTFTVSIPKTIQTQK